MLKFLSSHRFSRYLKLGFLLWDLILLNVAQIFSFYLRFDNFDNFSGQEAKTIFLITNVVWIALALYLDAYKILRIERIETTLMRTFRLVLIHAGIIALFIVILNYDNVSRMRIAYFYAVFACLLFVFRVILMKILKQIRSKGYNYRSVVIIGANNNGERILKTISSDLSYGYKVVGYFDDMPDKRIELSAPVLGDFDDVENFVKENKVDEMYIALHINKLPAINKLTQICEHNMVRIKFLPNFYQYTKSRKVSIDFYNNIPILMLRKEPLETPFNRLSKKLFDILFSFGVIVLIFPWMFPILMLAIKIGSKGPVFFSQKRSGENNKSFKCLKFRTMRVNSLADELQATMGDPRITKLGAFLRKTSLDELPQFFNVLAGQMSVVGPRPHMLRHTKEYTELINNYLVRQYAKPGITGWAQINGYRGETKDLSDMRMRVEYDIWFIENWTFLLDLKIIWMTVYNMFLGEEKAR